MAHNVCEPLSHGTRFQQGSHVDRRAIRHLDVWIWQIHFISKSFDCTAGILWSPRICFRRNQSRSAVLPQLWLNNTWTPVETFCITHAESSTLLRSRKTFFVWCRKSFPGRPNPPSFNPPIIILCPAPCTEADAVVREAVEIRIERIYRPPSRNRQNGYGCRSLGTAKWWLLWFSLIWGWFQSINFNCTYNLTK
jgi:hypothetical protein